MEKLNPVINPGEISDLPSENYICPDCQDKHWIHFKDDDGYQCVKPCKCLPEYENKRRINLSGLAQTMEDYTFDKFATKERWQDDIKRIGLSYVECAGSGWFFIGGQVGSGKSHICTAITGELMKRGKRALYARWRDLIAGLKRFSDDNYDYVREIDQYKQCDVLYLDDLFKSGQSKTPSEFETKIAYEILDYRYSAKTITIISSEKTLQEILEIDEATGGRIFQRSKAHCINIPKDKKRDMRLRMDEY